MEHLGNFVVILYMYTVVMSLMNFVLDKAHPQQFWTNILQMLVWPFLVPWCVTEIVFKAFVEKIKG